MLNQERTVKKNCLLAGSGGAVSDRMNLSVLPARLRLALEMTLHEDDERRAMEGELAALEARWREADEIAKIADSL